ncbi:hypothetical protein B6E66_00545 [Streptomyces maremycinicus]|nr:hypothetical protein B6E66_00545 [Streptomyces sp. B9173]
MSDATRGANAGGGDARTDVEVNGAPPALPDPAPLIVVRSDGDRGDRAVVAVRGELDHDSAEELARTLRAALDGAVGGVDLELGGVEFCDCSALNVLIELHERSVEQGKTVTLRTAGPAVERLLTLTGTRMLFDAPRPERADAPDRAPDGGTLEDLRMEVVQLRRAMQTRPVIDVARGILMASFGLNVEEAWRVLVLASQNTNTKLYHLARDLVAAVLGEPPADAVQEQVAAAVAQVRSETSAP